MKTEFTVEIVYPLIMDDIHTQIMGMLNYVSNKLVEKIILQIKQNVKHKKLSDEEKRIRTELNKEFNITGWDKTDPLIDKLEFYIFRSEIKKTGEKLKVSIFIIDDKLIDRYIDIIHNEIITREWLLDTIVELINKYIQI